MKKLSRASSNRLIPNSREISGVVILHLAVFHLAVWSTVKMMKEKVLSTFSGNAKLARVATGLDDSGVPEKRVLQVVTVAGTNKMNFYWVVVNSCLLHIYRIGKCMAKIPWFYLTACAIWANMVLTDALKS